MDHATTMLDLDVFRTRLRPGIEYVGRVMGCKMDIMDKFNMVDSIDTMNMQNSFGNS